MSGHFVSAFLTLAACFMLMCRIDKMMKGVTKGTAFVQHAVLAIGLFGSFVLEFTEFEQWSTASMASGVLAFFAFSLNRWRFSAPEGTTRPGELDASQLRHISGGRKQQ